MPSAVKSAEEVTVDVKVAQVEEREGVVAVTAVGVWWTRTRGREGQGLRGVVARLALRCA
jgi:hypothetical protein